MYGYDDSMDQEDWAQPNHAPIPQYNPDQHEYQPEEHEEEEEQGYAGGGTDYWDVDSIIADHQVRV